MYILLLLLLSIAFIIVSTSRWNFHPFISLLLAAFFFGVASGMPANEVLESISAGFGSTIGKIGLIIIFGIIIGVFLEKSGGAARLANRVIEITGKKRIYIANALTGYILSIPVFADSGFLILASLNKAMTSRAGVSLAGTSAALALGLIASHTMVPPTPGPIAAAGLIEADLGTVFLLGVLTSLFALVPSIIFSRYTGRKIYIDPGLEEVSVQAEVMPSTFKSFLPLAVPIVLILLRSVAEYPTKPLGVGMAAETLIFLGNPVIALFIGALLSLTLPAPLKKSMLGTNGWVGEAMKDAALIILITGAGGALGKVLQDSELGNWLGQNIQGAEVGIWVPFIMASAIKTAQGSSTVAIITTASIMAPLLGGMGLDTMFERSMVVIAIGAGSAMVSHANDSFFWVVSQLSNFTVNQGYRIISVGTVILGLSAMIFLTIISMFLTS